MKRSVTLFLCAVVLAAIGMNAAQATVDVALNIKYTDPADPNDGGTWTLVAKTGDPNSGGLTGLVARFTDIAAAGVVDGSIGHDINDPNNELVIATFGSEIEFVYGQDPNDGLVGDVGLSTGPSNVVSDVLNNSVWDDASVIATGTFADLSTRPTFVSAAANQSISGTITAATIGLFNVRGDSLVTLGLESPGGAGLQAGDADRDGDVDIADLGNLAGSLGGAGAWDDGDTDGDGDVDIADLGALAGNLGATGSPPAIGAIPEPASMTLTLLALSAFAFRRRVR